VTEVTVQNKEVLSDANNVSGARVGRLFEFAACNIQESRAIAKMTAQCALYMDALKIFWNPWLRPRLLFPKLLMGFCCDRWY